MPHTQKLIIISLALVAGIGLGFLLSEIIINTPTPHHESPVQPATIVEDDLKTALLPLLEDRFGSTSNGYSSHELLYVYKGMQPEDFDGVETASGHYEVKEGYLWHISSSTDASTENITDAGYATLDKNIRARIIESGEATAVAIAAFLQERPENVPADSPLVPPVDGDTPVGSPEDSIMCTMDAKMCPDGSFVGRTGPDCAFAACPDEMPTAGEIVCTDADRQAEACIEIYAPVCASYQVQCITTPCNPVPKSYSNSCFACADQNVISYSQGVCASDPLISQ